MRLFVVGQDERSRCLKMLAEERGHVLSQINPDAVVLPLPKSALKDMKRVFPEGQRVVCGRMDDALRQAARKMRWVMLEVLDEEQFQLENAWLTAEGAVYRAMELRKRSLCGACCLVIGYGRIGKRLTNVLRALGAFVTVAARKETARQAAGKNSIGMQEINKVIGGMHYVFNTVPSCVVGEESLKKARKDAVLMELASAPYGFELGAAEKLGLKVHLEAGIPGRYCPADAARCWLDYIERSVQAHE